MSFTDSYLLAPVGSYIVKMIDGFSFAFDHNKFALNSLVKKKYINSDLHHFFRNIRLNTFNYIDIDRFAIFISLLFVRLFIMIIFVL